MGEPTTEAGKRLLAAGDGCYHHNACAYYLTVRGCDCSLPLHVHRVESEAREQGAREERERLRALLGGVHEIHARGKYSNDPAACGLCATAAALLDEPT